MCIKSLSILIKYNSEYNFFQNTKFLLHKYEKLCTKLIFEDLNILSKSKI